jgi:TolA-binding protein
VDHFAALEAAFKAKDYALVRTLGHEYVNRYATDDKADDALYWTGKADLDDARPASALGEWNRLLKLFPKSNMLEKTLFGMGQAYESMHDCANAKLAYGTVLSHFAHGKLASEARTRTAAINALPAGSCAPP